ncbi:MAG: hypothetical protein KJO40_05375 [Deltaproteobacteria bacterium]|nr:hypothetical protein [Deltaproteobacteria bacterium]NND28087.1 hypothetical protein [Myxococcales bacterium]MBT8463277.1 hypothetical protein [Deltaproteobacteria bacterium]MBT8482174.1 hypothetical protein [Deltaproteobacteria bacterium]NNK09488.1 hypothetical protein [Myxococcales bacterium]
MRLFAPTLLAWSLMVSLAHAQADERWLIVPSSSSADTGWVEPAVGRAQSALVAAGVDVWAPTEAANAFEKVVSAPPSKLSKRNLGRWMSLSDGAVDDLAEGDPRKALQKLNAAQAISREAIEELNREPERARRVFDTCLYMVRAVLATEPETRARALARECRQLVPRAEPSPYMHPPAVTDLLDQIDALQTKQTGELQVESVPSRCAARVNGVLLGETPTSIGGLFPGDYRVQVDCGAESRGRVHVVTVGAGTTRREIDARFDDVVTSRPSLLLEYQSAATERRHRVEDARRIGAGVGSRFAALVSMPDAGRMELQLVEVGAKSSPSPLGLARVAAGGGRPTESDLALAARALVEGRCLDFTKPEPTALPCARAEAVAADRPAPTEDRPRGRRPRGQFIAGLTLVGVGVAGLATGYALLAPRSSAALDWVSQVDAGGTDTSSQQKWFNLRGAIIASASVGSAALITAMPLALPEREKTPWWAWVSGGVGLGLAGFSIAWGVTAEAAPSSSCSGNGLDSAAVRSCVSRGEQTSVALLTGLTSAPLITMPLVYLFRPSRAGLEPQVQVSRSGGYFGLRGRF